MGNDPWAGTIGQSQHVDMRPMRAHAVIGTLEPRGMAAVRDRYDHAPALSFASLATHRPAGPWQGWIPLSLQIRSDFLAATSGALQTVSDMGATLPLLSAIPPLPPMGSRRSAGEDMLRFVGRVIHAAPATALVDAEADPILLARPRGTVDPWMVMARVLVPGRIAVPRYNWDALQCDAASCATVAVEATALVAIEPILARAGFRRPMPAPVPTSGIDPAWARFENHTGLMVGETTLGDELRMFYDAETIAASMFNDRLDWVWNGETFG